jgi:hypothetical protein
MLAAEVSSLLEEVLQQPFDPIRYVRLAGNLVKELDSSKRGERQAGNYVYEPFREHIAAFQRLGQYTDPDGQVLDVLAVEVKDAAKLDRARTALRNFAVEYLKRKDDYDRETLLVAYYAPGDPTWRLSYIQVKFEVREVKGRMKAERVVTQARRLSYLVGKGEPSHTAATQLRDVLRSTERPALSRLELAFGIEKVSDEFFQQYKTLFANLLDYLQAHLKKHRDLREEFEAKGIEPVGFAKKLLGQLVFLYFLQKKGWLGVPKKGMWGEGDRAFLRTLWQQASAEKKLFFDHKLNFLFYEALADDRKKQPDPSLYRPFDCRIPFLNGGLFEPEKGYDWRNVALRLPNELFSNQALTPAGDVGTGILDVFDRFNFTVKEDEPLEREVAVDPEMLGKVFERLLEVKDRKSKGAFYTPREIVHHMCQQSLATYLADVLNGPSAGTGAAAAAPLGTAQGQLFSRARTQTKGQLPLEVPAPAEPAARVPLADLSHFLRNSALFVHGQRSTVADAVVLQPSIEAHAAAIDKALADIRVLDPAIGSGAFPVGILTEIVQARLALSALLPGHDAALRTPYKLKYHCIRHCLHGVDVEASAVDIAKLRLWLSLVVDEDDLQNIDPLPNLDYKLVVGNSLNRPHPQTGFNVDFDRQLLNELMQQEFTATQAKEKGKLRKQIEKITQQLSHGEFDCTVQFPAVFTATKTRPAGFDLVIGNPPYGGEKIDAALKTAYGLGKDDVYGAFLARFLGNRVPSPLRPGGLLSFIVSDTFMTIKTHLALREQLLQRQLISMVRVHGDTFDAVVNTVMVLAQNAPPAPSHHILMGDLTNVSAREKHARFLELLAISESEVSKIGPVGTWQQSSPEYAFYRYPQSVISTCNNRPFFVASPKLLTLLQNVSVPTQLHTLHGCEVPVRNVNLNGKSLTIVRLGSIAEVRQGLATGDNLAYVFKSPDAKGSRSYRSVAEYSEFLLTEADLERIRSNENLRLDVIENGIIVDGRRRSNQRYFGGRYIMPFDKGGESDTDEDWMPNYYVPTNYFIDWSEWAVQRLATYTIAERIKDRKEKKVITASYKTQIAAVIRNASTYYRAGLTFSPTGEYAPTFRINSAAIYGNKGSNIFPITPVDIQHSLLAILCSKLIKYISKNYLSHTVEMPEGQMVELPIVFPNATELAKQVKKIIKNQQKQKDYKYGVEQTEIDRIVFDAYGLNQDDINCVNDWYNRRYDKMHKPLESESA